MSLTQKIAKHFREVFFGNNWTSVNLKDSLREISWEQATTKLDSLNSIAALVFHIDYYVSAVLKVLQGEPLNAHDKYSFDLPPIQSQDDWQALVDKTMNNVEIFAGLVENLPEEKLWENLADPKYGNYYRNINGIIEHTHYHLGQIVIIKKLLNRNVPVN